MSTATVCNVNIEAIAPWGPGKRVDTKAGPRILRKAPATEEFWAAWKAAKVALKAAGVSCSPNRQTGEWEACWWQPVDAATVRAANEQSKQAMAASRAAEAPKDFEVPVPAGLRYLPYQLAGVQYASTRDRVLIGDDMGLGKTVQAAGIVNADSSLRRILIVCPASLRINWQRELQKWLVRPMSIAVVTGTKASDWKASGADHSDIVIINYDICESHAQRLHSGSWDLAVLDEAHKLKNPKAKRTVALLGREGYKDQKAKPMIPARRLVMLTGTPITNRPVELWPLLRCLDPADLGRNFFAFATKYCDGHQGRWGWDFTGASNLEELQQKLRERVMVRRLKSEVLTELPAKRRQVIAIPATDASAVAAVAAERSALAAQEAELSRLQAAIMLAKAAGDDEAYVEACRELEIREKIVFEGMAKQRVAVAMAKVPHVIEHLQDALESGPVVVFAHHHAVIDAIAEAFPGAVKVTGKTPTDQRQQAVDDFQAGRADLFIGNIQAAGVGLTLTRSSHVVFAELSFVPADMTQAEDRTHRIGQDNQVLVQHLVLDGSIDAAIVDKLIRKQEVITAALDEKVGATEIEEPEPLITEVSVTVRATRDELRQVAETLTADQISAIHGSLRALAGVCDAAMSLDGCGFSKIDVQIGHALAHAERLTPRQAALGRKLCVKYQRQLSDAALAAIGIERK